MPPNFEAFVWRAAPGCLALNLHIGSVLSSSPLAKYWWLASRSIQLGNHLMSLYQVIFWRNIQLLHCDFTRGSQEESIVFLDKTSLVMGVSGGIRGQAIPFLQLLCMFTFFPSVLVSPFKKVRIEVLKLKMCRKCQVYLVRSAWSLP